MADESGKRTDPAPAPAAGIGDSQITPVVQSAAVVPASVSGPVVGPPDQNPALVYLASLGPSSRRTMRGALDTIARLVSGGEATAETLPWHTLRRQHTAAVRAALANRYGVRTANRMLAALRGVLREAAELGLMDAESFQRASRIKTIRGKAAPAGRALDREELRALFTSCAGGDATAPIDVRDAALLAVLYGAGLRRAEAVQLDVGDLATESGALVVHGKGNKVRLAYVPESGRPLLAAWVSHRGAEAGPLFLPVQKDGVLVPRRLTEGAIYKILERRARVAGVPHFSPHDCRRTFIGDLLDAGADMSTVKELAGHASIETTARYDRRGERAKRTAADLLRVPGG
jgi:integrase/recombinase XerC